MPVAACAAAPVPSAATGGAPAAGAMSAGACAGLSNGSTAGADSAMVAASTRLSVGTSGASPVTSPIGAGLDEPVIVSRYHVCTVRRELAERGQNSSDLQSEIAGTVEP